MNCPIQSHLLTAGAGQYSLTDNEDRGFDLSLRNQYRTDVGTYPYTIRAMALGGATGDASGVMDISNVCDHANVMMLSDHTFYIPEYGQESETLVHGSYEYITDINGCSYEYSLTMASSSYVPDYYSIDQYDGSISFSNRASQTVDDYIGIKIQAKDSYGNQASYETEYFRVTSECGIDSTTVLPPTQDQVQLQMYGETVVSVTGTFGVTNAVCPIQIISLLSQSTGHFRLDQTPNMDFVVTRLENPQLGDPEDFTVFAQAHGYATDEFTFLDMTYEYNVDIEPYITPTVEVEEVVQPVVYEQVTITPTTYPNVVE